ncbi:hypothetical protein [Pseudomonas sp. Z2-11]
MACFTVVVFLILGLGFFSLKQMYEIRGAGLEIENQFLPGIALGNDINLAFAYTRYSVMNILSTSNPDESASARDELNDALIGFPNR